MNLKYNVQICFYFLITFINYSNNFKLQVFIMQDLKKNKILKNLDLIKKIMKNSYKYSLKISICKQGLNIVSLNSRIFLFSF
jgi:hypothetical protein